MAYSNITITTNPGLSFRQYDFIQVAHDAENYIIGRVVSYNSITGVLVFTPLVIEGSGSFSSWEISLTGDPGIDGTSGSSGSSGAEGVSATSGTSGTSPVLQLSGYPFGVPRFSLSGNQLITDDRLTFDGRTLTIDPFQYSTGGNPIYRIVYHDDGTAGKAGIVVRGPIPGQPYSGIIENSVPHEYQHQFVVGSNFIAHIDAQGLHTMQALIADNGVYFQSLERDDSQTRFLVWDPSTSGGLQGKVKWTTSGAAGQQGPPGISGSSGSAGSSGSSGTAGYSGTSGQSGTSGTSGLSGVDGTAGTSGVDGTSGTSGQAGPSGTSGSSGQSGSSGTSGVSTGIIPAWTSAGAITITGTTSNPTKGTTSHDNISYRQIGTKEWEIILTYNQTSVVGALAGSGDYLITLPNGLSFDTTLPSQQIYTSNVQTSVWTHSPYIIPSGSGLISNNTVGGHAYPMVYSSTKFRVLTITYGSGVLCWGSGFYSIGTDVPKIQLTFRFTST